jgi:hypothetical protein
VLLGLLHPAGISVARWLRVLLPLQVSRLHDMPTSQLLTGLHA